MFEIDTKTTVMSAMIVVSMSTSYSTTIDSNSYIYDKKIDVSQEPLPITQTEKSWRSKPSDSNLYDFDKAEGALYSYIELETNWDGYGGVAPQEKILASSRNFLLLIKKLSLPAPKPMLTGSGEVSLYWEINGTYIEVSFEEENFFSYLISSEDKTTGEDDLSFNSEDIPNSLLTELMCFVEEKTNKLVA